MRYKQFADEMDYKLRINISPWFFAWMVFPTMLGHAWWSLAWRISAPISAGGGLIIIFGIITAVRPFLRLGWDRYYRGAGKIDGGYFSEEEEPEEHKEAQKEEENDFIAEKLAATALLIVGTAINAYGGMLGDWLLSAFS